MCLFLKEKQLKICSMFVITENNIPIHFSAKITLLIKCNKPLMQRENQYTSLPKHALGPKYPDFKRIKRKICNTYDCV